MGPRAPGTKHAPAQDSDSDDQMQDSDTNESDSEAQHSDSEEQEDASEEENEGQHDESEHDSEDQESEEGQDYQGMTMQELLKLQEDMGTKAFRNKVLKKGGGILGKNSSSISSKPNGKQGRNKTVLKRANKNRPAEVPMMRQAAPRLATLDPGHSTKRMIIRDPRFDDLSGNLNLKAWQENYSFLKETRKNEKELLKKELKVEQDPEKKVRIKSIIQRIENQERERARREKEREVKRQERQEQREALRKGRKPKFLSSKERKLLVKAAHFEDLKKGNKLEKYLERKEKRLKAKEMKRKY